MTAPQLDAYRAALDPWKRKAERERLIITHVRYERGHADVTLSPRPHRVEPEGQLF